jgi:hypothetical protein
MKGTGSLAAASFYKYGSAVKDPSAVQEGDIGVMPHHVGFMTGRTEMRNGQLYVEMVGGNQGGTVSGKGGVSRVWRRASTLSIRHPDYEHATKLAAKSAAMSDAKPSSMSDAEWDQRRARALNLALGNEREGELQNYTGNKQQLKNFTDHWSKYLRESGKDLPSEEENAVSREQQRRNLDQPVSLRGDALDRQTDRA